MDTNPILTDFDADDIQYLVGLGLQQLRREISNAVNCQRLSRCQDVQAESFWEDFGHACRLASDVLKSTQPKLTISRGNFIDTATIKANNDIVDIAGRYTRLIKSGANFKALCPFHGEKHSSFWVYPDKQSWHCFGACNTGGDIFSLVMKGENTDFKGAVAILGAD